MADEARCTPLHPENMDATCSDVRGILAPTSFHNGPWRVRERFERRQSLDRPVEPSGQAVADDGESTREREYRVSDGGRDHDRCTGVMVLSRKVDTMCVWLIDSTSVE